MKINPLRKEYHTSSENFREQIAVLYATRVSDTEVHLLRSFVGVGSPGLVSFDPENPGADTEAAWKFIDNAIENDGVRGVFHTHPPDAYNFSSTDFRTQRGLARTYGEKMLWHGVQQCPRYTSSPFMPFSGFSCMHMVAGKIFRYEYHVEDHLDDPVIVLPMPKPVQYCEDRGAYVVDVKWQTT